MNRNRVKQTEPLEQRLADEAKRLCKAAHSTPHGVERDRLIRRARQAETATHLIEFFHRPDCGCPYERHATALGKASYRCCRMRADPESLSPVCRVWQDKLVPKKTTPSGSKCRVPAARMAGPLNSPVRKHSRGHAAQM
jgi:hypothetical protein